MMCSNCLLFGMGLLFGITGIYPTNLKVVIIMTDDMNTYTFI